MSLGAPLTMSRVALVRRSDAEASEDAIDAFLRTNFDDIVAHLRPLMRAGEKGALALVCVLNRSSL